MKMRAQEAKERIKLSKESLSKCTEEDADCSIDPSVEEKVTKVAKLAKKKAVLPKKAVKKVVKRKRIVRVRKLKPSELKLKKEL